MNNKGKTKQPETSRGQAVPAANRDSIVPAAGSQRHVGLVTFDQTDPDGARRNVVLAFKPETLDAISSFRSTFGGRLKNHGGMSSGFADLSGTRVKQLAVGPVAQVVETAAWQRYSAIGPTEEGLGLEDPHGIALGVLEGETVEAHTKEALLVRVKQRTALAGGRHRITLELRRSTIEPYSPLPDFRIESHLIFKG